MLFYGLDRMSEDLDFDCRYKIRVDSLVKRLQSIGEVFVKKDTDTTKRISLIEKPTGERLKIEISLREKNKNLYPLKTVQDNLKIYDINDIFLQKISAFLNRKTARDLYDIAFISKFYYSELSYDIKKKMFSLLKREEAILDLIPEYEELFKEDKILTTVDLLESIKRLVEFYERAKTDLINCNNKRNNKKLK